MYLNELSFKLIKTIRIYRITTLIILVSALAKLVAYILSLQEIIVFDIATVIYSILLFASAMIVLKLRKGLKKFQKLLDYGEAKVLYICGVRTPVKLQSSYMYESYDDQNNWYMIDKDLFIPSIFVKEVFDDKIILFEIGSMEQETIVNLIDFSIDGDCVVEVNENKYLFSNSDIFIEMI